MTSEEALKLLLMELERTDLRIGKIYVGYNIQMEFIKIIKLEIAKTIEAKQKEKNC